MGEKASFAREVKYCGFEVGGLRVHYAGYYGLADSEVETKKAERDLHTQLCLFLIFWQQKHQKGIVVDHTQYLLPLLFQQRFIGDYFQCKKSERPSNPMHNCALHCAHLLLTMSIIAFHFVMLSLLLRLNLFGNVITLHSFSCPLCCAEWVLQGARSKSFGMTGQPLVKS